MINGNVFYFQWEVDLILWIQSWLGTLGTTIASLISYLGETIPIVGIVCIFYFAIDKNLGKKIVLVVITNTLATPMIKNIALRLRPYMVTDSIQCLKPVAEGDIYDPLIQEYSFPSGHSSGAVAFYGAVAYYLRKRWITILSAIIIILVGISRFALGVHYPTDVLAGWILGTIVLFLVGFLEKRVKCKWKMYLVMFLITIPGWFYCISNDFYSGVGMFLGYAIGDLFEEKFVNFTMTKSLVKKILRVIGGLVVFELLEQGLKLPFSSEFLAEAGFLPHLVRTFRYAVATFATMGLYPLVFSIWDRKELAKET